MELVVLSGKGGTGKTTIATAIAELTKNVVKVDCDVDAPNLYLFYKGSNIKKEYFYGRKKAVINQSLCIKCRKCEEVCRNGAIKSGEINLYKCEGCGTCTLVCPSNAIKLKDKKSADIFITKTDKGIISRAEMDIGSNGSGKLITSLRKNAKRYSDENTLTIIDGSPGIGCPVISSVTNSDISLIVTEPTRSGMEDFKRVAILCKSLGVFMLVCINKFDINEEISKEIKIYCNEHQMKVVGKIPYDDTVMKSINELKSIIYYENSVANTAIREMWKNIKNEISN